MTALIGPNGCGKTTAGKIINRILTPSSGSRTAQGHQPAQVSRATIRKYVGYVPQSSEMVPAVGVVEFLLLGRRQHPSWKLKRATLTPCSPYWSASTSSTWQNERFSDLSGGQRRSAGGARHHAAAGTILFDEPTSALDLRNQLEIMRLVQELAWEG